MKARFSPSKLLVKTLILSKGLAFIPSGPLSLLLVILSKYDKMCLGKAVFIICLAPVFLFSSLTNPGAAGLFALLVLLILGPKLYLNDSLQPTIYLTILIIILQFLYSIHQGSARPHMVGYEQNFSALAIMVLYLLIQNRNRIWFFLVGAFTISRMFVFAIFIRELLFHSRLMQFGKIVFYVALLFLLVTFLISHAVVLGAAGHSLYSTDMLRIFDLNDTSNLTRFNTNLFMLEILMSNMTDYLFHGMKSDHYVEINHIVAHNSILQLIFLYGVIPSLVYLLIILYYFSQDCLLRIAFITIFFSSLVLHSVLSPINIALIYILLKKRK